MDTMKEIPKVRYAVIGGSGTWAGEYPENTGVEGVPHPPAGYGV